MPRVTLTPQDDGGITIPTSAGGTIYFPQRRIRIWVRVGGEYACRQAILELLIRIMATGTRNLLIGTQAAVKE